jgi:hypothetical protein
LLAFSSSAASRRQIDIQQLTKRRDHEDDSMKLDDFWGRDIAPPASDRAWNHEVSVFLSTAAEARFEMRYVGEDRWYPVPADDVALTLAGYHPDLGDCLDRLLDGEEVASRLARFRVSLRGGGL